MNYQETTQYLLGQLPFFTRDGISAYKGALTNIIELCSRLGNPQHKFKSVHIAGTNGKGSTAHMLAAILQTAGYKTGLFTTPHLKDLRESVRINGQTISEQEVIDFVEKHKQDFEGIRPSFFEVTVALAFDTFASQKVDIAIIEVGLGGRDDSTNIINPLLSVITNIGWDHMNILGYTLPEIATVKAGIIKPGVPVIIGEYQTEVAGVFIAKAKEQSASISFASTEWEVICDDLPSPEVKQHLDFEIKNQTTSYHLQLDLTGLYQLKNVKSVLSAVSELRKQGCVIDDEHIGTALRQVKTLTGLRGRWEVLTSHPLTICDTGHNPDGIKEVLKNIDAIAFEKLHFVIGMMNDKDSAKILALLPKSAVYYFCKPGIPRGLEAADLKQKAEGFGLVGDIYPSSKKALETARQSAGENDLVFVGGSAFVVAEIL